jgi:hypothetical protein
MFLAEVADHSNFHHIREATFAGWGGENAEKDPRMPFKMAENLHFSAIFCSLLKSL